MARKKLALTVTVHQPDERLATMIEANLPLLASRYAALMANCSKETHPTILDLLRSDGAVVRVRNDPAGGIQTIGQVRRDAIRAGLAADTPHMQMCDFDRAIHWVAHYPDELDAVIAEIPDYDLLVLGRTERAWATHPAYQFETEALFNRVFALVTGQAWDVGAGSRGLSRRAVETVLAFSQEPSVGTDAEWPLLLLNQVGFRVEYRQCEGLEFETGDRFGPEIEAAGGYEAWMAEIDAEPERWVYRAELALMIARAVVRYGSPPSA
jgi:hypothetical protein